MYIHKFIIYKIKLQHIIDKEREVSSITFAHLPKCRVLANCIMLAVKCAVNISCCIALEVECNVSVHPPFVLPSLLR